MHRKKPKIAIIHPALGKTDGGSQIFVLELAKRLRYDFDITILSGKKINSLCKPVWSIERRCNSNNYFYNILHRKLSKYSNSPDVLIEHMTSFIPVLTNLLITNYDLIYPNNDWGGLFVANIVRKIKKTPIVFTEHCGLMEDGLMAKRNLKFLPDRYVVLSQDMKHWVKSNFSHIKTEMIPNGVDFSRFNINVEPVELNFERPIFLSAGRYYPNKRLELAIDAVSQLEKGSLIILSTGCNLEKLRDYGKQRLGNRFHLDTVAYNKIPGYYKACDVFTLPSEKEPFGLVYLEAMACNKPVVAPLDESRKEIVGNAGVLCNVTNIDEYANALKYASEHNFENIPLLQAKKYSLDETALKYKRLFMQVLADKKIGF